MSPDTLTAEQVKNAVAHAERWAVHHGSASTADPLRRLADSHEALRAELVGEREARQAAEQERDDCHAALNDAVTRAQENDARAVGAERVVQQLREERERLIESARQRLEWALEVLAEVEDDRAVARAVPYIKAVLAQFAVAPREALVVVLGDEGDTE